MRRIVETAVLCLMAGAPALWAEDQTPQPEATTALTERDFIVERGGGDTAGRQYGFAMDLVRVWLEQNDEYTRLLEELRG